VGPEVAARLGVALPTGDIQNGESLDAAVSNTIPIVLEGGYRVDPSLFFGVRFQYAFASFKHANGALCTGNASCGGSDVALGIEGMYRFVADGRFAPWLGLAGDYEWLNEDVTAANFNAGGSASVRGFRGALQFGGDVRVTSRLVLGPFIEAQFGRYESGTGTVTVGNTTTTMDVDIRNTTWHEWVVIGARGAFGF
jgi:hypothetical protein